MPNLLTREEAQRRVDGHTFLFNGIKGVSLYSCGQLLGDRLDLLLADPIRNKGPTIGETIYPWNVVDYLSNEDPMKGKRRAANSR